MPNEKPSGLEEMAGRIMRASYPECTCGMFDCHRCQNLEAAILSALREAEARGAREMRERAAKAAELANNTVIFKMGGSLVEDTKEHVAGAIRSLPLPGEGRGE